MKHLRLIGMNAGALVCAACLLGAARMQPGSTSGSAGTNPARNFKVAGQDGDNIGLDDAWAQIRNALPRSQADADALSFSEANRLINGALRTAGFKKMKTLDNAWNRYVDFTWNISTNSVSLEFHQRCRQGIYNHYSCDHYTVTFNPSDIAVITWKASFPNSLESADVGYSRFGYDSMTFCASDAYIRVVHDQEQNFYYRNHDGSDQWDTDPNAAQTDTRQRYVTIPLLGFDGPSLRGLSYLFVKYLKGNGATKDIPVTEETQ